MALIVKDRVQETTTTTGTGAVSLLGAVTGYQNFGAIGNANTTYYCIAGQTTSEWEVGIGTYTAAGASLSRDTVVSSSNSGSLVAFSAGTKNVFVTYPSTYTVNSQTGTATTATNASQLNGTAQTNLLIGKVGTTADINAANDTGSFSARGDATYPASMSFHRAGVYAINCGLSTSNTFVIGGWSASSNAFSMTGVGALTMLNNVTAFSDERVKTNWRDLQPDFIERLAEVKHGIYDRTDQVSTQVGVGAQSLRPIMEHAIMENDEGQLSVAYGNAALVACVKLAQRVVALEEKLEQLIKDKS